MKKVFEKCPLPNCSEPIHCRGFCRKHYRSVYCQEGKRRWLKIKNDPIKLEKVKRAIKTYKSTENYRMMRRQHDKKYLVKNGARMRNYRRKWNEVDRFGVVRVAILYRDGFSCALCGATENLVVHHKNNLGRASDSPDNKPENLITLCRSCHMKIHKEEIQAGKISR